MKARNKPPGVGDLVEERFECTRLGVVVAKSGIRVRVYWFGDGMIWLPRDCVGVLSRRSAA